MGGKTTIAQTLAGALTMMERMNNTHTESNVDSDGDIGAPSRSTKGPQVRIHRINPKSVTIGRLYGDYEAASRDWQDGILAKYVRESAADKMGDTHWITLDGPVDTIWIENLNTVLDDNKKLCLISGEIVKLTPKMTMMFEVEDLLEASPATVSRCGMVYVTPEKLGWQPLLTQWIQKLPEVLTRHGIDRLYLDLIYATVPAIIDFLFGKE